MPHDPTRPTIKCLRCSDVIQSAHVHDFVWCSCKSIAVDGGGDYTRLIGNAGDMEWKAPSQETQEGPCKAPGSTQSDFEL